MKKIKQILIAFSVLAPLVFCNSTRAEGIDCSKAINYMDKIVCTNADIKAQDATMAELYAVARVSMFGKGPSGEIFKQKTWLYNRKDCLPLAKDKRTSCVLDQYKARNLQLAFSAMPKVPEAALKVLREQKIKTEPVYEALTIFASEPDGSVWFSPDLQANQAKIIDLISPVIEDLKTEGDAEHPNKRFATQLLGDAGISKASDVFASSGDFAGFLRAATFESQTPLPCGYVITRQALLDSTNANFGASPDNFIMISNCSITAPPTPKFQTLLKKIWDSWPNCEGTIRFGAYRNFNVSADRVLSPSLRVIDDYKITKVEDQGLIGVNKKNIRAAELEMTAYYVKYLGATQSKAAQFAKGQIIELMSAAHQCE
jgi:uncharacterized protein